MAMPADVPIDRRALKLLTVYLMAMTAGALALWFVLWPHFEVGCRQPEPAAEAPGTEAAGQVPPPEPPQQQEGAPPVPAAQPAANQEPPGPPPEITSVSPREGLVTGGTEVTIKGKNFAKAPTVLFDAGQAVPVLGARSTTKLVVATPKHAQGPVNVTVRNRPDQSVVLQAAFVYTCPSSYELRLFAMVLLAGVLGGTLHAMRSLFWYRGKNELVQAWALMYVLLPFVGALVAAAFYLVVRAGLFSPESKGTDLDLLLLGIAILVGMFSEQAVVKLKQIAEALLTPAEKASTPQPGKGKVDPPAGHGGDKVTLHGSGFSGKPVVTFGGKEATEVEVVDANTLTAVAPTPDAPGSADVKVTIDDKVVLDLPKGFRYKT